MTVSSSTAKVSYSGNGSTQAFAVPFYFLANSQLLVVLRSSTGTESTQVLGTNYTVTGAGVLTGGTVTMTVAPASGQTLVISRNVPLTQETDLQPNDRLPAETLEQSIDKLTMITQQLDEATDRTLKFPVTDSTSISSTLPSSTQRANKYLAFDSTGAPTTSANLEQNVVSVKSFGAVGNGTTDDRAAIVAAQNYAASIGGATVYFPPGEYKISAAIPMLPGITYQGPMRAELGAYNAGRSRLFSSTSDVFTNTATLITGTCFRDLFIESASGGGHIFNWSNTGVVAKIEMSGVCLVQKNAAKSVIYGNMGGGASDGIFSIWLHDFEYEYVPTNSVPAIYLKAFTINSISISNFWSTANGQSSAGQPSIWIESTNAAGAAFNVYIKQGVLEYASSGGIHLLSCANSIIEDCTTYDSSIAIGAPVFKVDKGTSGPSSNNIAFRACRSTIGNATHADLYLNTAESGQGSFWVENCTFSYLDSASTLPGTATAIVNSSITNFVDTAYLQLNFSPESNIRFGNSLGSSKYYDIFNGYFNNFEGYLNILQNGSYIGSINPSGNFYWGGTRVSPNFYVLKADGKLFSKSHIYPGTGGGSDQDKAGLLAGEGAPSNGNGNNGDFYFRSDGGSLTTIYQKRAGSWVGIV